jgi:hypothetical protein
MLHSYGIDGGDELHVTASEPLPGEILSGAVCGLSFAVYAAQDVTGALESMRSALSSASR